MVANGYILSYKNFTDYKNIPVGTHTITVENDGSDAITLTAFFNGFSESTLYATSGPSALVGILLMDDNSAPAAGKAHLRVLHGAGSAPAVDVLSSGTAIIENLAFGLTSAYLPLSAGSYSLSVNAAGSEDSVFTITLPVTAGPVITVLAAGDPTGSGAEAFTLIVVTDAVYGEDGNLRAFHAVTGGPVVNIKADGTEVFGDVPFKAVSPYLPVAPGLYKVSVHNAAGDVELFRSPIRIDAESYFTAVAGGDEVLALFQLRDDSTRPAASTTHLRVVHASATSPEVNIEVNGDVVGALIYTEVFGYAPLPSTSYVVRVATTSGNTQVFNGSLALEADTVISAFAVGKVGDNTNPFGVVVTIDFDYRTPVAAPGAAPGAAPSSNPSSTPTRTPTRTSSAVVATASVALMALAALVC